MSDSDSSYVTAANNNNEDDNDSAASTEENYTQSEIEEKNDAIEKFLHVYKQYKSCQELLSKLEEAVDSDKKRDYYIRFAHHLLQCEENGMRLQELPVYSDKEYQMESLLVEYEESKKKEHTKDNVMQLSDNPWKTSGSETKINVASGMDLDSTEANAPKIPLKKLKEVLFRPGMKFRGEIVVPGMGSNSSPFVNDDSEEDNLLEDDSNNSTQPSRRRNDNSNSIPNERGSASSNTDESNEGEESRKSYELVVYRTGEDPFGNYVIAASHAAYGDEQSVRIQLSTEEIEGSDSKKRLNVKYSDGETSCEGYWNEENFRLEGNVRQKLQANDGIFHTSEVTHVFTLYPCTSCFPAGRDEEQNTVASAATKKLTDQPPGNNSSISSLEVDLLSRDTEAIAAHRKRTEDTNKVCVEQFLGIFVIPPPLERPDMATLRMFLSLLEHRPGELSSIESQLNDKQKLYWKLHNVDFSELLTQANRAEGEHTCATFRSRAVLLDSFHFNTIQDRDEFIAEWKEKKIDLQGNHQYWDRVNFLMKSISQMLATFEPGGLNPQHQSLIFTSMHRLHVSYECLESAYRRAEKRLTKEELTKYEINTDQQHQEGLKNVDCIICQMPLLDEVGEVDMSCLYKLPCSHCFHKKCVEQWLHNNSTCPACRLDLTNNN